MTLNLCSPACMQKSKTLTSAKDLLLCLSMPNTNMHTTPKTTDESMDRIKALLSQPEQTIEFKLLTPKLVIEMRCLIEDGLEPTFIEDAGIETMSQHLEDIMERVEDQRSDALQFGRRLGWGPSRLAMLNKMSRVLRRAIVVEADRVKRGKEWERIQGMEG